MSKVVTLSGLTQVDELPKGSECTPVEDATLAGSKVIRCKEDVVDLDKVAPEKMGEVIALKKRPRKRGPGHSLGSVDRPCVPEWITQRMRGGKTSQRCHCKNGRLVKSSLCKR